MTSIFLSLSWCAVVVVVVAVVAVDFVDVDVVAVDVVAVAQRSSRSGRL